MISALLVAGVSFVLLGAVFWPLERLFPARAGQKWLRPAWLTDLGEPLPQGLGHLLVAYVTAQELGYGGAQGPPEQLGLQ